MPTQAIEIGLQTPVAAASALKKAGYNVTSGGKAVNVSENDNTEQSLNDGEGAIHTKKWDRCVKKVKADGKSEESAYKICSSSIKNAGVQSGHQQKTGKQYVANRNESETNEGETMLDVFPELNDVQSQDGGEVKSIKVPPTEHLKKTTVPKEEIPKKVKRDPKIETKITNKSTIMEKFKGKVISKKEVLEVITGGGAQPATQPGPSPTETPTITPSKPGEKPKRRNPFHPKPGPNPNPKGKLPNWMSSDKLGIGKNQPVSEDINEISKLIKNLI